MNPKNRPTGIVFSTIPDFEYTYDKQEEPETLAPEKQNLRLQFETKQRGGKMATVVKNFVGKTEDLEALGKQVKSFLGTGGSVKEGEIIIQGDFRQKLSDYLKKLGYKVK